MTDAPLGPGWWQASDGKWYPPQPPPGVGPGGPFGSPPGPDSPYGRYDPARGYAPRPSTSNPFAVAAMVCACLGVLVAFVPFFFWLAGLLGLTAIGLGIAGIVRARSPQPASQRGLAIAATAIGGLAVIAAVVSMYAWSLFIENAFDEFADDLVQFDLPADASDYDASIDSCEVTGGRARATGTITNTSTFITGFSLDVLFRDADGIFEGSGYDVVFELAPGESASFTATSSVSGEYVDCEMSNVYYN